MAKFIAKKKEDNIPVVESNLVDGISEDLRQKFLYAETELNTQVIEMTEVVRGILLAMLSGRRDEDTGKIYGEHLFMISTPGAAKSYLSKKMIKTVKIALDQFFIYQFHPFSLTENVVGAYDLQTLDTGLKRKLQGFLPRAVFANLDEIFKAGPIRDILLMILNERRFQNGSDTIEVPLISAICSSNEYPKSSHDAALWDRLLLRYKVQPVTSKDALQALDKIGTKPWNPTKITLEEIARAKSEVIDQVNISQDIYNIMTDIYQILAGDAKIELSPRRMKSIYNVLRASAWLSGRSEVIEVDITSAIPCMWLHEDHIPVVRKLVRKISNPSLDKMAGKYEQALSVYQQAKQIIEKNKAGTSSLTGVSDLFDKIQEIRDDMTKAKASTDSINKIELDRMLKDINTWHKEVLPAAMKDLENN